MEVSVWSHQLSNINDKFGQEDEDQISIRFSGVIVLVVLTKIMYKVNWKNF